MTKTLSTLNESIIQIPGCEVSSLVSRKNGLTLFRSGHIDNLNTDKLNRELAKLFSSSPSNPYGDAWNLPQVDWLHLKVAANRTVFAMPINDDFFWSVVVTEKHPVSQQRDIMSKFVGEVVRDFEQARSK